MSESMITTAIVIVFALLVLVWQIKSVHNYNKKVNAGVRRLAMENKRIPIVYLELKERCIPESKTWLCKYCGSANRQDAYSCSHCGASKT